ncbi:ribonuclease M5 [Novibacillus thermophilus]|uniref:Ribonuclease M5 n=1 Tax=Novibacillus thermophilus TaxID=1471761 RepID=A0A1U9KB61_9BACL|nr:ribonuclease M5 [Novibacillus thermophilus]
MVKEMIVVEGRDDTAAVRRAVDAETIETGGSALRAEVMERIRLAQVKRGVIVLTDPDYPGERIRRIIREAVPGCKHAFIPRELASKDGKAGVEYAPPDVIRHALAEARAETLEVRPRDCVTWENMIDCGLTLHPQARKRREAVGRALGVGYANAQGLYKRLNAFHITPDELRRAVQKLK